MRRVQSQRKTISRKQQFIRASIYLTITKDNGVVVMYMCYLPFLTAVMF